MNHSLHNTASPALSFGAVALAVPPECMAADGAAPIWMPVLPPPGADGLVPTADGRRLVISSPPDLVRLLNAAAVRARVDYDHQSERTSPTFVGSTAARGWIEEYRLDQHNGIEGRMDLAESTLADLRARRYRHISPATFQDAAGEVVGLSSIALVNDPNMLLRIPRLHAPHPPAPGTGAPAVDAAIQAAWDRVIAAELVAMVHEGWIDQPQVEYHRAAIAAHPQGPEAGLAAFRAAHPAGAAPPSHLTRRIMPTGQPPAGTLPAPAPIEIPPDVSPPREERVQMHAAIQALAREAQVPYREAIDRYARGERARVTS